MLWERGWGVGWNGGFLKADLSEVFLGRKGSGGQDRVVASESQPLNFPGWFSSLLV